ncbi:MAG: 50S ribosomal protein L11 [archaeon]
MKKQTVDVMVEGGKASAGATMGSALGPLGVNIGQIIAKINEKTKEFSGMKVPVKIIVDPKTKEFDIEVGTPPTSALITKELNIQKGAGDQKMIVGNLKFESAVKIAKMKGDSLSGKTLAKKVKEIIGTCKSMGVTVEGKDPTQVQHEIDSGDYNSKLSA